MKINSNFQQQYGCMSQAKYKVKLDTKDYILYNLIYINCVEQVTQ